MESLASVANLEPPNVVLAAPREQCPLPKNGVTLLIGLVWGGHSLRGLHLFGVWLSLPRRKGSVTFPLVLL